VTTIAAAGLRVAYDGPPVLRDLDLVVPEGDWLGLVGPNGAGKSTLLRAVAGLVPFEGRLSFGEADARTLPRRELARLVAYVPQRPHIPEGMPVADYVLLGRTPHIGYLGTEGRSDLAVAAVLLDRLELGALADRPLGSLSGGELQRVVLARALAQEAPVLLLDEPTAALDVGHQQQVLELIDELRLERSLTVVAAMHDLTLAAQFAADLVLLDGGVAVAVGSPHAVLTEDTIRRHYGASVRVVETDDGVSIVPVRVRTRLTAPLDRMG
jgi:iron complex transport system ATP-binding protein